MALENQIIMVLWLSIGTLSTSEAKKKKKVVGGVIQGLDWLAVHKHWQIAEGATDSQDVFKHILKTAAHRAKGV